MTEAERGYVAGMLDGEGCIGLTAERLNGSDGTRRNYRFGSRVDISNTNRRMLEYVQQATQMGKIDGGSQPARPNRQVIYRWRCPRSHIRELLREVLPYLQGKRDQAELLLEFLDLQDQGRRRGDKGLSRQDVPRALEIHQRLHELKGQIARKLPEVVFEEGPGKPRATHCEEPGCEDRKYHRGPWCYKHWMQNKEAEVRHCIQCGKEYESRNVLRKYCSDRCQAAHTYDVTRGPDRERHVAITEEQVKEAIRLLLTGKYNQTDVAKHLGVDRASLGQILRGTARKEWKLDLPTKEQLAEGHAIWRKKQKLADRPCEQCGETFTPKNPTMRFCGRPCYWKAENARRRAARLEAREG